MSECIALIDLGSNAVRLILAGIVPGVGYQVLREQRIQTRLGGGCAGMLSPSAIKNTVAAVREFLRTVRRKHDPRVLAVATSAVREATNREHLLDMLKQRAGACVERA